MMAFFYEVHQSPFQQNTPHTIKLLYGWDGSLWVFVFFLSNAASVWSQDINFCINLFVLGTLNCFEKFSKRGTCLVNFQW